MKIKVILSTFGPLHLMKSAEYLSKVVDIRVIQGWIPGRYSKHLLKWISMIVGRDISKTIKKRTPASLNGRNNSVGLPEFYMWFCNYFTRMDSAKISYNAALFYGWSSRHHIQNANIFHVRSGSGLGGAIEIAKKRGLKVVVDQSAAHPKFMQKQLEDDFVRNNAVLTMTMGSVFWQAVVDDCTKADCLLVNSEFVKQTFVDCGFDIERIKVVYLGVRDDFFGLKSDYKVKKTLKILFTGNFGLAKGVEYLLRALKILEKREILFEMTIVGSFEQSVDIIEKYNVKNINFVGHIPQDELKKYLSESDIYLFPSLTEGCASSGMEAMAAGLPVIATYESGLPIENHIDGLIISSKDEESIVEAVVKLLDDEQLRERLGKNAARKISTNYTWDKYAESVSALYNELL
jgi:Glycosyltransferase